MLFLIENNHYSFSTPTSSQYDCRQLSDRAHGYGIAGRTIDGIDAWDVYTSVCDALEAMRTTSLPMIIECMTLRLHGHAAYDKGDYVPAEKLRRVAAARSAAARRGKSCWNSAACRRPRWRRIERAVDEEVRVGVAEPWRSGGPIPSDNRMDRVRQRAGAAAVKPYQHAAGQERRGGRPGPGLPVGEQPAGVPVRARRGHLRFGLQDLQGADRAPRPAAGAGHAAVRVGAWSASPWGPRRPVGEPILEFQFADFSTEAVTQLGLNAGHVVFPQRASRPRCCCGCPAAAG